MTFRFRYRQHLGRIVDEFIVKQLEYKTKVIKGNIFDYQNCASQNYNHNLGR